MTKENLPEIQAWFVPRQVPFGDAPENIKEQWVGVPLPLRQIQTEEAPGVSIGHSLGNLLDVHIVVGGAQVLASDAIKALHIFDRPKASDFLRSVLFDDQTLTFGPEEGQFFPPAEIQRILPGVEQFDFLG